MLGGLENATDNTDHLNGNQARRYPDPSSMLCLRSKSVYCWTQPLDVSTAGVPQGAEHSGLVSEIESPYDSGATLLPKSLVAAIERFETSEFYKGRLGADTVSWLTRIKRAEWDRYLMTVSEWEQREYFSLF